MNLWWHTALLPNTTQTCSSPQNGIRHIRWLALEQRFPAAASGYPRTSYPRTSASPADRTGIFVRTDEL